MFFLPKLNQKGAIPLLILIGVIGLLLFLFIANIGVFKDKLFSLLYPKPSSHAATNNQIYWGSWVDLGNGGTDPTSWNQFEADAQKKMSIIHFGNPWQYGGSYMNFPISTMDTIRNRGSIPLVDWGTWNCCSASQTTFSSRKVASGQFDEVYVKPWAQAAKTWGHPFFLRLDWEMNIGGQFPWNFVNNAGGENTAQDYINMWRHLHDVFEQEGATNVTWVWVPNVWWSGSYAQPAEQAYPGDSYVDWNGLDGYDFDGTWNFSGIFTKPYNSLLVLAPNKPIMLGEWGTDETGDDGTTKANWIHDALSTQLPNNFPNIKAVIWFNWAQTGNNWPIESSLKAQASWATNIASPYYAANTFGNLADFTKIQPLAGTTSPTPQPVGQTGSWNLVFNDEFDGTTVDLAKWRPNWLGGSDSAITKPVNSAETACYDPAQATVANGELDLTAIQSSCSAGGTNYNYRSGMVESNGKFNFAYGYMEAKIWTPAGAGVWPAFWSDGQNWPTDGEIDAVEAYGTDDSSYHYHYAGCSGDCNPGGSTVVTGATSGWHTYAADWEPGVITWYYDGKQVWQYTTAITSSPQYLILNLGLKSTTATVPSTMKVDYVRVWKKATNPSPSPTSTPTATLSPTPTSQPSPPSDTTPPTVSITSPLNGATVVKNTNFTISANASDNIAISKVEFYVDGGLKCTDTTATYSCTTKIGGKPGATHTITAKAYDISNNSSSASISVKTN